MRRTIVILIFFYGFKTYAQPIIDSLKAELFAVSADSSKFRLHCFIGQQYLKAGEFDSQFVHASKALELSNKIFPKNQQQKKIYAGSLRLKGIYYRVQGDFDQAINYYV